MAKIIDRIPSNSGQPFARLVQHYFEELDRAGEIGDKQFDRRRNGQAVPAELATREQAFCDEAAALERMIEQRMRSGRPADPEELVLWFDFLCWFGDDMGLPEWFRRAHYQNVRAALAEALGAALPPNVLNHPRNTKTKAAGLVGRAARLAARLARCIGLPDRGARRRRRPMRPAPTVFTSPGKSASA